jgi:acyl-CoA thioester hydrolase
MSFERKINYYETDGMGIVHHSNYIRFLEEARIQYLDEIGLPYKYLEDTGISIPVIGVECEYKSPAKFDDIIVIDISTTYFNGIKMEISYTITNKQNKLLVAKAITRHCFTNKDLKPISLKKYNPEVFEKLNKKYILK